MGVEPVLELADRRLSFGDEAVLAVDPPASLLRDLVAAWSTALAKADALAEVDSSPETDTLAGESWSVTASESRPGDRGSIPELRVLARRTELAEAFEEFHAASRAADLVDLERLALRVLEEPIANPLLVDGSFVAAVLGASPRYAVSEDVTEATDTVGRRHRNQWADAGPYQSSTPSRTRIARAFANRFDGTFARDLLRLYDASDEIRREDPCNQLVRPYLIGARHRVHHYDLRRAGEEAGLASQATFSRIKAALVEDGVIETERVPRDVGRPRQRLVFANPELEAAPIEEYPALTERLR